LTALEHSQCLIFHAAVEKIDYRTVTAFDVIVKLNNQKNDLTTKSEGLLSSALRTILGKLEK
jgi:hypothetical protein